MTQLNHHNTQTAKRIMGTQPMDPGHPKKVLCSGGLPPPFSACKWTLEELLVKQREPISSSASSCTSRALLLTLEFADKRSMTHMLGRISAFSEGKANKGLKSEAKAGDASRGYYGHNFPLTVLEDFSQIQGASGGKNGARKGGEEGGLARGEQDLVDLCQKLGLMKKTKGDGPRGSKGHGALGGKGGQASSSYLIAHLKHDLGTRQHELCHARYFLDPTYRQACLTAWEALSEKHRDYLSAFLSRLGYHEAVHADEFQAFALTEKANFWGVRIDVAWPDVIGGGEGRK
ncbi:hypothetical protein Naga_101560g2 [Nannochloropsis gaditana]|uniref:Uncharacterized protein n=1 Tax=Nannochloropsis gaditana TaxID=72520 RepID=W7TCU4_9STRA|nr:hypothetical protein Naga_101560g2 [Nannochloropsis gaditana]